MKFQGQYFQKIETGTHRRDRVYYHAAFAGAKNHVING